jgi:integrase
MKVNPKFRLRKPQDEITSIYLDVRYKGKRLVYGTGLTIDPKLWNNDTMRATNKPQSISEYKKDPNAGLHCKKINSQLNKVQDIVFDYLLKAGENVGSPEEVKAFLIQQISPEKSNKKQTTLKGYIDRFITEIESGQLQTSKGTKYAATTIKAYKSFRLRFNEFQTKKRKVYDFDDIDQEFYDRFTTYLTSIGNKPGSTGKQIKCLKSILRIALDEKIHNNRSFQSRKFKVQRPESEAIYLTEAELSRISKLDLSKKPHLEIARDVFLIGCYTAQRISDYSKINQNSIRKTAKGNSVIDLRQTKTGNRVVVPIKPELTNLLKKYDYSVPHIFEQKLNDRIKEVGKLAGISESVHVSEYKNGLKVLKHVPKYSLIQSHTARRTGATLMYLAAIPLPDLMTITGHRSIKQLMQYIKVTEEETAEKLSIHPYFTNLKAIKK